MPDKKSAPLKLPESWNEEHHPFVIDRPGFVLWLNDVHIPFHVSKAVEAAVRYGKERKAKTIYLNGDIFDFHVVSRYPHDGSKLTYNQEIQYGREFLAYLRQEFPKADIIFKEGNHEERLEKYILSRAEALFDVDKINLRELCDFEKYGVQHVGDQRLVKIGKLNGIHGHEYGGGNSPVSAARWLILRAKANTGCGHLHQTSETSDNNINDELVVAWSVGCLCGLKPRYRRFNARWNHGCAGVELFRDGSYHFDNRKIIHGKVT